jgi:excisionase family DNA binding protein
MSVHYARGEPQYDCLSSRHDQIRTRHCRSVRAATVDEPVTCGLLAALSGEQVALALAAADEVADRHTRTTRAAELAVERARSQADRAERALLACEPENRLVARTLETRFETRLAELAEARAGLVAATTTHSPLPGRDELEAAVADLERLWTAPTTSDRDRKRLLRTLVADVTLLADTDPAKLRIGIRWRSGATEEILTERVTQICEARRTNPATVDVVRRLGPSTDNAELADQLNTAGHRTGTGRRFNADAVRLLRRSYGIPAPGLLAPAEVTVADVAGRLGVARSTVTAWIHDGLLTARRTAHRYCVNFGPDAEAACRARVAASPWICRPDDNQATPHDQTPAQVAERLGISRDAVYNWIRRGHLSARRGQGGRTFVTFTAELEMACWHRIAQSPQLPADIKARALQHASGDAL